MSFKHHRKTTPPSVAPAHRATPQGTAQGAPQGVHRAATTSTVGKTPRRTMVLMVGMLTLALGVPAGIAATGGLGQVLTSSKPQGEAKARNLVVNGDFEAGTTGWRVNKPKKQRIGTASVAANGRASASLSPTEEVSAKVAGQAIPTNKKKRGLVTINDARNTVLSTTAGRKYAVVAYVRARGADIDGRLRVREVFAADRVGVGVALFRASRSTWTKVGLTYVAKRTGSELDLNVIGHRLVRGSDLLVDNISLVALGAPATPSPSSSTSPSSPASPSASTSSPAPTKTPTGTSSPAPTQTPTPTTTPTPTRTPTPTPTPTTPPSSGGCVSDPMGIPPVGQTLLGAAVNGTSVLEDREAQLGRNLALRRTYYSSGQIDSAVRTAKSDLAAGRLPWISFKAPYSWAQMAAGAGDAWSTELGTKLATVPGPVWLAVHHEPEGDGDLALWTAMQAKIAPIIHARSNNVAYSVIYSGWNTFGNTTNSIPTKWPGDANVDITAIDAYNDYGTVNSTGRQVLKHLDIKTYYEKLQAWSKAHGTAWAIGETALTPAAAADDPTWLDRAYTDMVALGGAGLAYYDSSMNAHGGGDWTLDSAIKLAAFKALLPKSVRVC